MAKVSVNFKIDEETKLAGETGMKLAGSSPTQEIELLYKYWAQHRCSPFIREEIVRNHNDVRAHVVNVARDLLGMFKLLRPCLEKEVPDNAFIIRGKQTMAYLVRVFNDNNKLFKSEEVMILSKYVRCLESNFELLHRFMSINSLLSDDYLLKYDEALKASEGFFIEMEAMLANID